MTDDIETCAWTDCRERFARGDGMPPGWVGLAEAASWFSLGAGIPRPPADPTMRDCVLCPTHAAALEALLRWRPVPGR